LCVDGLQKVLSFFRDFCPRSRLLTVFTPIPQYRGTPQSTSSFFSTRMLPTLYNVKSNFFFRPPGIEAKAPPLSTEAAPAEKSFKITFLQTSLCQVPLMCFNSCPPYPPGPLGHSLRLLFPAPSRLFSSHRLFPRYDLIIIPPFAPLPPTLRYLFLSASSIFGNWFSHSPPKGQWEPRRG